MATSQSPIFWLMRIYHFATAHLPVIYQVQIDQLFHHCKSCKYLITVCSGPWSQTTFVTRGSFLVRVGGYLGFAATVYIWNPFS